MTDRLRRLRRTPALRDLVAETEVSARQLVQPHFVIDGDKSVEAIDALPGIDRMGLDPLLHRIEADLELGLRSALLFGVSDKKDAHGSQGENPDSPLHRSITAIKKRFGDALTVIADVCLCTYTDHGHCGILKNGEVDNDGSLPLLARQAVSLAEAGADLIAPSDMMDHRVAAIRNALDEDEFTNTGIMSYAAKFASSFYGPFRSAADSSPSRNSGEIGPSDRRSYQMDFRNGEEALREVLADCSEGADIVMVKPALAYLDIIARVRSMVDLPLAAYLVSGEYAAIKLMAREGLAEEASLVHEQFHAIRRAGAQILISYHGRQALAERWL
ncbi:MAG: porphobilinogen synthase [Planctomycetota bacterium]|jgi:porphobilinogen synthase